MQLKNNLLKAQKRMKLQADGHRKDLIFQEGDWVMVKLHPYKQQSLALRLNFKLCQRYYGPFQVMKRIGQVAYQLQLPTSSKIHPVFHVSQLKPFSGSTFPSVTMQLPDINLESQPLIIPAAVLNDRWITINGQTKHQMLVQWKGLPMEDSSWEDSDVLEEMFPHMNLEDQVQFDGGRNVTEETVAGKDAECAEEGGGYGVGRIKRIRQKPSWMKEFVVDNS
ncbi:hypothetical protein Acr_00g0016420 [Actinidia rufa]|uniref:Chromo domain-containing protein n=1 Tax=Actinidia rufa TaxID=165716 RepID=A0A7J0DCA1_9ERIC|nr:hypothetical protein Acr_00g0016420 [Actinidia rufa]